MLALFVLLFPTPTLGQTPDKQYGLCQASLPANELQAVTAVLQAGRGERDGRRGGGGRAGRDVSPSQV